MALKLVPHICIYSYHESFFSGPVKEDGSEKVGEEYERRYLHMVTYQNFEDKDGDSQQLWEGKIKVLKDSISSMKTL